ncbi:MAG: DUF423 domain-containing protein [Bacteroidota bacterium]
MKRTFLITGSVLGLTGIILGAFGAHGLERIADADGVDSFVTGVRYQIYHAFFMLFVGVWDDMDKRFKKILYGLTLTGVILFSGSIYALVLGKAMSINLTYLGPITPLGGLLLIMGWFFLVYCIWSKKK